MILKLGSSGQETKRLQSTLGSLKIDGDFGPKTHTAVEKCQSSHCLVPDGIAGKKTMGALGIDIYPGVDVSHHNGRIRWDHVDPTEAAYAWVKISEGKTFKDPKRRQNLEGARKHGILVGGYHFGRPENNSPKEDVDNFLAGYGGSIPDKDLIPVLDLEAGVKGDPDHNRQWSIEWLEEIHNRTGRTPMVYTAKWFVRGWMKGNVDGLDKYPLWICDYTTQRTDPDWIGSWAEWVVWQWTSKGHVGGIGRCDCNWLSGGPNALDMLKGSP